MIESASRFSLRDCWGEARMPVTVTSYIKIHMISIQRDGSKTKK